MPGVRQPGARMFQLGNPGNPYGRKGKDEIKLLLQDILDECPPPDMELPALLRGKPWREIIVRRLVSAAIKNPDGRAMQALLERAYGKVPLPIKPVLADDEDEMSRTEVRLIVVEPEQVSGNAPAVALLPKGASPVPIPTNGDGHEHA